MFNKLLFYVLIICSSNLLGQVVQPENELLWEISGNGLKTKSYLYGSLHSNDKRIFNFSDSTYFALSTAESIVLETDLFSLFEEWDTRQEEVLLLIDNNGKPYTGSAEPTKTIYGNEDGMPQFLDAYFLDYCYNAGKFFFPLEQVKDQLQMMSDWGQTENSRLGLNPQLLSQEKLIDFYVKGDISSLDRLMKVNLSFNKGMHEDIIISRNQTMAIGLDTLVRKQSVFCAVGSGHLAGELGMINLLRAKGYKLRRVLATFSEQPIKEKQDVRSKREFSIYDSAAGLLAIFPGKPKDLKIWDNHPYLIYREMGQGNTYSIELVPIDGSLSLQEQGEIYIAGPDETTSSHYFLDDGTEVCEGLSDTYPEGPHWIRLIQSDQYLVIMKAYGGNKFMNSNRPKLFFSKVGFE
jgi:uncharacterized protein YbaP (TraB family)